ncbi:tis11p [Saccharomyces arboricola H-6]|uniref:Tis11p n=1 Tax=Saccharomyces arboricola (strain H-6 / AS 2.3317 / CBS 10644) TaxID=1160507 RepID=J8PKU2_SACAR|nr:tis11p [Saccharomyces arboricola H-6]
MWAPLAYTRPESQKTDLTSLFSTDQGQNPLNDYQYQVNIRELEDYYNKTILKEDNIQETSSEISSAVSFSPSKQKNAIQPELLYNPQLINPFLPSASLDSSTPTVLKKKLEVQINPDYVPKSSQLPLTLQNLQQLSQQKLKSVAPSSPQKESPTQPKVKGQLQETPKQLYKTELCESFTLKGTCPYGTKCQFAHGLNELKVKKSCKNFRTKPCLNWEKLGYCPYGRRCCFKHGDDNDIAVYVKAGTYSNATSNHKQADQKRSNGRGNDRSCTKKKNLNVKVKALQRMTW